MMRLIILIIMYLTSSYSSSQEISLIQWDKDFRIYVDYYGNKEKGCDDTQEAYDALNLIEFKKKIYSDLTKCASDDKEMVKEYLLANVLSGLHPDRIDMDKYGKAFSEIESEIDEANRDFWKSKDTTYFSEIERRVRLDQILHYKSITDSTNKSKEERLKVFEDNTKYLLDYCVNNGFPFKPSPSHFNSFRTEINPTVIAIHANQEDKIKLLNYAIESAKKGVISWHEPISICSTFHTNAVAFDAVKPILFFEFKTNNTLDVEASFLQLYSIKKLYDNDMKVSITIQPSKYNKASKSIINDQLIEIKKVLIEELEYNTQSIFITKNSHTEEKDYTGSKPYAYTLKVKG